MRRPQFTLKTLLWLMALVVVFFAGRARGLQEVAAERRYLKRLQEETEWMNKELDQRIAEWTKEVNALTASQSEETEPLFSGARD